MLTRFLGEVLRSIDEGTPVEVADRALAPLGLPMSPIVLLELVGPGRRAPRRGHAARRVPRPVRASRRTWAGVVEAGQARTSTSTTRASRSSTRRSPRCSRSGDVVADRGAGARPRAGRHRRGDPAHARRGRGRRGPGHRPVPDHRCRAGRSTWAASRRTWTARVSASGSPGVASWSRASPASRPDPHPRADRTAPVRNVVAGGRRRRPAALRSVNARTGPRRRGCRPARSGG